MAEVNECTPWRGGEEKEEGEREEMRTFECVDFYYNFFFLFPQQDYLDS